MEPFDDEMKPDDLTGNMIVMGFSLIVIASVVIGVVAGVDSKDSATTPVVVNLHTICNQTDYKESCIASLERVGDHATVETYFRAAVNATISEMVVAMMKANFAVDAVQDEGKKMALQDCIELIGLCIEQLQSVITTVSNTTNLSLYDSSDARSSLSAVISYQRACLEGLKESHSTYDTNGVWQKSRELASNALAIIYGNSENDDAKYEAAGVHQSIIHPEGLSAVERMLLQTDKNGSQAPNAVVAKDGSGQYASITDALNAYPNHHEGRYLIYVKSGVYEENVIIAKNMTQIFMYGDGVNSTVISGKDVKGTSYRRATLSAIGNGFICKDIGIKIPDICRGKYMAAVKIQSDSAAFFNCRINGSTSSVYALAHRQFFVHSEIYGVTSIIRGDAAVVIQSSKIVVTQPSEPTPNIIALQARSDKRESTGFVIHGCTIKSDKSNFPRGPKNAVYLGMAMERYSRIIVMESTLGDLIHPEGWYDNHSYGVETVTFVEYRNTGRGAQTNNRVRWPGYTIIKNSSDAWRYSAGRFIQAQKWLQGTTVPLQAGLFH